MIFLISSLHLRLWDALFTLIYIGHSQSAIRWIADFPHYSILISDVMCGPSGLDFSNGSRHCASSFRIPFFYHFASLSIPFLHLVLQRWGDIVETLSNTLGMLRCCTSHVCVCSFPIKAHNQWCTYLQICIYIYDSTPFRPFSLHCQTNLSCFKWPGPSGQKKGVKANVSKRLATNQSRGGGDGGGVATLEKERRQAFDEPSSKFHQTSASRNNDSTPFRPFFTALPDESELFQMTRPFRPKERCQGQCLQEIGHKSKSHNP